MSASTLVTGDAEAVGIIDLQGAKSPLRIYYPATAGEGRTERVGWFVRSFGFMCAGYAHAFGLSKQSSFAFRWLVSPLLRFIGALLPLSYAKIPHTARGAPFQPAAGGGKRPCIVFSHGLTGTGEEHGAMFAAWAKKGIVVVTCHHTDGSSSRVPLPGGDVWYDHGPSFSDYDRTFRPRQISKRAEDVFAATGAILHPDPGCPAELRAVSAGVDPKCVVAGGFSYGAATAALAATMRPEVYCGAVLHDGWFHIDVSSSAGIEFEFPEQAFDAETGLRAPSLFVNSAQFASIGKLHAATRRLVDGCERAEAHTLEGTTHHNFTDLCFWLPAFLHGLLQKTPVFGTADPVEVVRQTTDLTAAFVLDLAARRARL